MDYASSAFDDHETFDYRHHETPVSSRRTPASLSVMERSVISLSLQDTTKSISELPRWRLAIARLFGREQPNRLANEPLEELRRFSILARVRGDVDAAMLGRFLNAGYTSEQADLVIHFLGRHVQKQGVTRLNVAFWLLIAIAAISVYLLMQHFLEEPAISVIVTVLTFATLASIATPRDRHHR